MRGLTKGEAAGAQECRELRVGQGEAPRFKKEAEPGRTKNWAWTRRPPSGSQTGRREAGGNGRAVGTPRGRDPFPKWLSSPEHFWSLHFTTGGSAEHGWSSADAGVGQLGAGLPPRRGLSVWSGREWEQSVSCSEKAWQ